MSIARALNNIAHYENLLEQGRADKISADDIEDLIAEYMELLGQFKALQEEATELRLSCLPY